MMNSIATLAIVLVALTLVLCNVIARRYMDKTMADKVSKVQRKKIPKEMQDKASDDLKKTYRWFMALKLFLTFLSVSFLGILLAIGFMLPHGESLSMQTLIELGNKATPFGCALGLTVIGCVMLGLFAHEKACDKIDQKHDDWVIPWMLLGLPILLIGALWMTHM